MVYSPAVADFDIQGYIAQAGGYLSSYSETVEPAELVTGVQIVRRVALETSINPQLLLAFLEYRSGWVRGQPAAQADLAHPIGFYVPDYTGLYLELSLVAKQLNLGYYGWRAGHAGRAGLPRRRACAHQPNPERRFGCRADADLQVLPPAERLAAVRVRPTWPAEAVQ